MGNSEHLLIFIDVRLDLVWAVRSASQTLRYRVHTLSSCKSKMRVAVINCLMDMHISDHRT